MTKNKNNIFLFFIIALSLFSLSFFQIESDYLWHIKSGEYMLHNGILKQDIFTWTLTSSYWISHEWLFEVVLYLLKSIFGRFHLFIYCFSMILPINLILYHYNKKSIDKNLLFSVVWFSISLMISLQVQGRPHLMSYLLFTIMLYILIDSYYHESNKIYYLPLIGILWSNVHGGSSNLIYIVPFIFLISDFFSHKLSILQKKRLIYTILLSMISVCINIHGFKMFYYPYINIMNHTMLSTISEWRSTSFSDPVHYIYILFICFVIYIIISQKKKVSSLIFLLLGFSIILGMKSIRFWYYTYLVSSFFIFDFIKRRKEDKNTYSCILVFSLLLCSLFFFRTQIFSSNNYYLLNKKDISVIKKENPKRLFNMYNYGGDLIYNDIKVFMDGRADLYSKYYYSDYLEITNFKKKSISYLEKYQFDYLLVDEDYPITTYLDHSSEYELIYSREDIYLYKKIANH